MTVTSASAQQPLTDYLLPKTNLVLHQPANIYHFEATNPAHYYSLLQTSVDLKVWTDQAWYYGTADQSIDRPLFHGPLPPGATPPTPPSAVTKLLVFLRKVQSSPTAVEWRARWSWQGSAYVTSLSILSPTAQVQPIKEIPVTLQGVAYRGQSQLELRQTQSSSVYCH